MLSPDTRPASWAARSRSGADHQPFDALVGISQPLFQPDHGLAARGKAEMPGLDDAGMHRTDRNLVQAVAFRRQEAIGRRLRQRVDAISQREAHAPMVVIEPGAGIGQAFRRQSEQIADGALQSKRRRVMLADRRIAAIGAIQADDRDFRRMPHP